MVIVHAGYFSHPLAKLFPNNLPCAIRDVQISNTIEKKVYVVCPKEACNALYKLDDIDGTTKCTHKHFSKICGTSLGHYCNYAHGKRKWKPFKTFQFIPPSAALKKFFATKEFNKLLDRDGTQIDNVIQDIKDGRIWKQFEGGNFFTSKYNLALTFNVDWYRPFNRSEYKVAALMLNVLNLPREERSKKKWTIIAGT